jgi:hypothetical protein
MLTKDNVPAIGQDENNRNPYTCRELVPPKPFIILFFRSLLSYILNNSKNFCPICKRKLFEHSELQDKICEMITIKQFANNCPGFDVQFRPFFED